MIHLFIIALQLAHAVVDGHRIWVPNNDEDRLIRRAAVRIFYQTPDGKMTPFLSGFVSGTDEVVSVGHSFLEGDDSKETRDDLAAGRLYAEVFDPANPQVRKKIQIKDAKYRWDSKADLSVLKLSQPHGLQSVPMAYSGCDKDSDYITTGFGTDENKKRLSLVKTATYRPVPKNTRNEALKFVFEKWTKAPDTNRDNWIVAVRAKGQNCFGDSGGPIFCKSKGRLAVAGVNSALVSFRDFKFEVSVDHCRRMEYIAGSRISDNETILEGFRRQLNGGGGDDSEPEVVPESH